MSVKTILVIFSFWCFSSNVQCQETATLSQLSDWMTGSFSSIEQSNQDTSYLNISLECVRIWPDQSDGIWLYVEQAMSTEKDKPYRQRIYHLTQGEKKNHFSSAVFDIPNKERFVGAHEKLKLFKSLAPEQLTQLEGCTITMVYTEKSFIGSTAEVCENSWGGATYVSSEVKITQDQLQSWDRGWDSAGKQVWGAKKGPYQFIKINR